MLVSRSENCIFFITNYWKLASHLKKGTAIPKKITKKNIAHLNSGRDNYRS